MPQLIDQEKKPNQEQLLAFLEKRVDFLLSLANKIVETTNKLHPIVRIELFVFLLSTTAITLALTLGAIGKLLPISTPENTITTTDSNNIRYLHGLYDNLNLYYPSAGINSITIEDPLNGVFMQFEGSSINIGLPYIILTQIESNSLFFFDTETELVQFITEYDPELYNVDNVLKINPNPNPMGIVVLNPIYRNQIQSEQSSLQPLVYRVSTQDRPQLLSVPEGVRTIRTPLTATPYIQGTTDTAYVFFTINENENRLEPASPAFNNVVAGSLYLHTDDREAAVYYINQTNNSQLVRYDLDSQTETILELASPATRFEYLNLEHLNNGFLYYDSSDNLLYTIGQN